jgi:hypothetical protein
MTTLEVIVRYLGGRGRTPMAVLRFSPRPQLAFCTGYSPPIPLRGWREQRGGGGDGRRGKGPA